METIASIQKYAENVPYFFAFQEITPQMLVELKERFPEMQWISYNNLTGQETRLISPEEERVPQERTALTVTFALSSGWKVEKIAKAWFSDTPNVPSKIERGSVIRPIVGLVATHPLNSKKIVLINTHSDHQSMKPEVREVTSKVFNEFIDTITENRTLPYIVGGDLNTFENCEGQAYYEKLRGKSGDYRDKILYAPKEIQKSTFIGLPADTYHSEIDKAGNVQPNALDHIFYHPDLLDLQFSFRDAAVCNKNGEIIDPYKDRAAYIAALKERLTASDHFANVILIKYY